MRELKLEKSRKLAYSHIARELKNYGGTAENVKKKKNPYLKPSDCCPHEHS